MELDVVRSWSSLVVRSSSRLVLVWAIASATAIGCSSSTAPPDVGGGTDASSATDAAPFEDTASADAAFVTSDTWVSDAVTLPDAFVPSDAFTCSIGGRCNDANPCPGDWRCYGFGDDGFCAPFAPECGGFVKIGRAHV
jgi:hypothetical protein